MLVGSNARKLRRAAARRVRAVGLVVVEKEARGHGKNAIRPSNTAVEVVSPPTAGIFGERQALFPSAYPFKSVVWRMSGPPEGLEEGTTMTMHCVRFVALGAFVSVFSWNAAMADVGSGQGHTVPAEFDLQPLPELPADLKQAIIDGEVQSAMPDRHVGEYGDAPDAGPLLRHDPLTGDSQEVLPPGTFNPALIGRPFKGIMPGYSDELLESRNFGTMVQAGSPGQHPARVNCKLYQQFTDTNGVSRWFGCSGTLVDAQTVVTAGHCVFMRTDSNGNVYNAWANQVVVMPGADGDANGDNTADEDNYGRANSVAGGLYSFTGWTNSGDFDWDIGWVNLDRPVGMLTGWHGTQYVIDCEVVIDDLFFYNFSYPGENCPLAGLHNGVDMYYWDGTWDDCVEDNQFEMTTGGGNCFDTVWGGMSGSSAYFIEDDVRYVLGICSNSDRNVTGRYARVWENAHDWQFDTVIPDGRGTQFDVHALNLRSTATSVVAGDSLPDLTLTLSNPTNASSTDDWDFTIYLSSDANITDTDTVIDTQQGNGSWTLGAMSNFTVNMVGPQIPVSTGSGTWFLGVQATCASDTDTSNNVTQSWDTAEINVTAVSSLRVDDIDLSSTLIEDGGDVDASVDFSNLGAAWSHSIQMDFRLSTNDVISTADVALGTYLYGSLGPLNSASATRTLSLPSGFAGGLDEQYWIGVILTDSSGDSAVSDDPQAVLIYERPANDECGNATQVFDGDTAFNTTYAMTDGEAHAQCQWDGQTYNDIWYTYTAACTGMLTIETCLDTDYDTDLVLYADDGGSCADLELVDCNDDTDGCGTYGSRIQTPVVAGAVYKIRVGGYGLLDAGAGTLHVSCDLIDQPNDDCENAIAIGTGAHWIDTQTATTDGVAHPECEVAGDGGATVNDLWYLWTAPCEGTVVVSTCDNVNYDSDLVIYEWGGSCGASSFLACNDDGSFCAGYTSYLEAQVHQGEEYLIRVGGWNGSSAGWGWMLIDCMPDYHASDLDGDGDVDIDDLLALLGAFGTSGDGDVDGDGDTDVDDLLILLAELTG